MGIYYATSTGGFYRTEINGSNIPADAVEITPEEYESLLAGQSAGKVITANPDGYPVSDDPVPEGYIRVDGVLTLDVTNQLPAIKKMYIDAVQDHMDKKAQEYGYDNIFTAVSYTVSTNETYKTEAEAFRDFRDACWTQAFNVLQSYMAGTLQEYPTVSAFIAALPEPALGEPSH